MPCFANGAALLKLLIFISALLTGLTGAMAGEQRIAASAHSVSQLVAVAETAGVTANAPSRPLQVLPSLASVRPPLIAPPALPLPFRPREAIPARLQV